MPPLKQALDELVTANRILAHEQVVDAFGHVSIRHPEAPDRYLMSRARAPECIELADLMEFTLDGTPIESSGRKAYAERHIHGAIYETNPGVRAVVHNHSPGIIPFGITGTPLRPVMHMCASMGASVPIWDSRTVFGDTNLLVTNMVMGRDLAAALGHGSVALMRGHGCVVAGGSLREVVFNSVYLELNAELQLKAAALGPSRFSATEKSRRFAPRAARLLTSAPGSTGAGEPGASTTTARWKVHSSRRAWRACEPGSGAEPRSRETSTAAADRCGTPGAEGSRL